VVHNIQHIAPQARIFEVSARTGAGMEAWGSGAASLPLAQIHQFFAADAAITIAVDGVEASLQPWVGIGLLAIDAAVAVAISRGEELLGPLPVDARVDGAQVGRHQIATALAIQWTIAFGGLAAELGEVFDMAGFTARGTSRGRVDIVAGSPTTVKGSASAKGFELAAPGLPPWQDEDLTLEVEALGESAAGALAIDRGRVSIKAADDTLEARVEGGVLADECAQLISGFFAERRRRGGG
jgi:hypothetical protein